MASPMRAAAGTAANKVLLGGGLALLSGLTVLPLVDGHADNIAALAGPALVIAGYFLIGLSIMMRRV